MTRKMKLVNNDITLTIFSLLAFLLAVTIVTVRCAPGSSTSTSATPSASAGGRGYSRPVVGWQGQTAPNRTVVPHMPITYPKYGEIWLGATHHNVTWYVSLPPFLFLPSSLCRPAARPHTIRCFMYSTYILLCICYSFLPACRATDNVPANQPNLHQHRHLPLLKLKRGANNLLLRAAREQLLTS